MIGISILFILWFFHHGSACSCKNDKEKCCYRTEFYGFQYGHLLFYTLLGFLYPKQFKMWISIGVLWEIFEYWLSSRKDIINELGGCLTDYKGMNEGPLWMRKVYGGKPKYENWVDSLFGIKNSTVHTWHYSVGENLTNVVGFMLGRMLRSQLGSNQ